MRRIASFTLIEIIVTMAIVAILFFAAVSIFQLGIRRWDVQTSYAYSMQTINASLERIGKDARNAMTIDPIAAGANTLYVFTLPTDQDASGNYVPENVSGNILYVEGPQVCYYLSDITGTTTVTGGTILWRGTAPAGSSTFTPDMSWSRVNTTVARCSGVQSFTLDTSGVTANAVMLNMTVAGTSGHTTKTYTIQREMYMTNHN